MSRSGYIDDYDGICLYRGAVERALRGKRGQALLAELKAALEAMPVKRLGANALLGTDGEVCVLGALAQRRGLTLTPSQPDPDGYVSDDDVPVLAEQFNVAPSMIREIVFMNDECDAATPEGRWSSMMKWICRELRTSGQADRHS